MCTCVRCLWCTLCVCFALCVHCAYRYQRQLRDMREQVKEAEAKEQELTKKKRAAVSSAWHICTLHLHFDFDKLRVYCAMSYSSC